MSGMKKFFGIGLLALLTTAYLTSSCSHDDLSGSMVEDKKNAFNDNFIAEYGQIDPNHDWGFGINGTRAFTRGSNDNKNQWGNPNYGNWQIPPVLTEGQILRVKTYFQQNPHLTFEAPEYKTYFVQQVYKGYAEPNNDFSPEIYKPANSNTATVIGSGHMDKLTVGSNNIHVDNFNYGTYNGGEGLDVLNTGATDESNPNNYHKDMITLVEDVRPTCVGFNESESSYQHNDHAALVSAATIDEWIEEVYGPEFGSKCVDGWDRDFVGLDYEATPADGTYVRDGNNDIVYAKVSDFDMGKAFVWDGEKFWKYDDVKDNLLETLDGIKFPVVSSNKNKYLGEYLKIDQNNLVTEFEAGGIMDDTGVTSIDGDASRTRKHQVLDLSKIFTQMGTGGCAVVQNDKGGFVKNFGGRDYYFSDWIVTLTPAKKQKTTTEEIVLLQSGRVFCEDLGTVDISDIDYNDVVFDAWLYVKRKNNDPTTDVFEKCVIQLLAAGGTIPVQVAGVNVHEAFGVEEDVMVNTFKEGVSNVNSAAKHAEYGVDFDEMPDEIVITNSALLTGDGGSINIKNIPIVVRTSNTAVELTAENSVQGTKAPLKFMAPIGTAWAAERVKIGDAYPYFSNWVQNSTQTPWGTVNSSNTCNIDVVSGTFFSATPTAAWSVPASTTDAEITSAYATITGGKMYVTNGRDSAKDLIKSQGGELAFQFTHNNTFFTITLSSPLKAGDVISTRMQSRTDTDLGLWFSTTGRPSSAPTAKIELPAASAKAWTDELTYTVATGDGICGEKAFIIYRATGKSTYFNTFTITRQ